MAKRGFDVFFALIIGILILPVMLVLYGLVYVKLGSPVLFKQQRPGKEGKPFYIYKFRTMTNKRDAAGQLLPNEERLVPFGKQLRLTSLDELPSLLNVLKGEMSLVGPRPLRMRYLDYFTSEQKKRHKVLPGITGYAQVNGRNKNTWEEKLALDLWYVEHHSIGLDIKILLQTVIKVLKRKDITPKDRNFEVPFDEYIRQKKGL